MKRYFILVNTFFVLSFVPAQTFSGETIPLWQEYVQGSIELPPVDLDLSFLTIDRVIFDSISTPHLNNSLDFSIRGIPIAGLYYDFTVGLTLDQVNPETFVPYSFTKRWDGFHFWTGEDRYSDGINDHLNFGFFSSPEIIVNVIEDVLYIRWAKKRRNWGVGEHSLILSDTARPFDAIEGQLRLSDRIRLDFLTGSLSKYTGPAHTADPLSGEKMLSLHRLQMEPVPWLQFAVYEAAVWGKRFELYYMNPLMSYFLAQNMVGDMDNIAYGGDLLVSLPFIQAYGSFFLDEIVINSIGNNFFQLPNNQYAFYTGFRVPLKNYLSLPSEIMFQYTKLEPYVYTHYPQVYPYFSVPVNISYTSDGENLGYPLPPNSDEFMLKFFVQPRKNVSLLTRYQYIRHGNGNHLDGQIEGDINISLDYSHPELYAEKNFLHDGIYEHIHVFTFGGTWNPDNIPLELTGEYSFVYSENFNNLPGKTVAKHLGAIGFRYTF